MTSFGGVELVIVLMAKRQVIDHICIPMRVQQHQASSFTADADAMKGEVLHSDF